MSNFTHAGSRYSKTPSICNSENETLYLSDSVFNLCDSEVLSNLESLPSFDNFNYNLNQNEIPQDAVTLDTHDAKIDSLPVNNAVDVFKVPRLPVPHFFDSEEDNFFSDDSADKLLKGPRPPVPTQSVDAYISSIMQDEEFSIITTNNVLQTLSVENLRFVNDETNINKTIHMWLDDITTQETKTTQEAADTQEECNIEQEASIKRQKNTSSTNKRKSRSEEMNVEADELKQKKVRKTSY